MVCANCMASGRVTPLRGSPERDPERDPERGFACLCFSLRGMRVASIAGPSGLPSVTVLVLICALARVWPERDPERVCFGPYQRLCAASVLGPSGRECICIWMPNGATLGQCELLDNVVFCCYGRPFKSQEAWL